MYKIILILLISIISFSCKHIKVNEFSDSQTKAEKEDTNTYDRKTVDIQNSDTVVKKLLVKNISGYINSNLGLFKFKFYTDSSHHSLKKIKIYNDNKLIQIIKTNKMNENADYKLIDWDFDGYKDITVLSNCGSGGCAYWIWNYSPSKNKFVYNEALSDVLGLEMDSIHKFIIFHSRAGYAQENWDTMKYHNNKLVFVKGLYQERWTDQKGRRWIKKTRSKIINNKEIYKVDSAIVKWKN